MNTVANNDEKKEVLSESEYSGDSAEDRGEPQDELVDAIRTKYPHLSRKKVTSMTKAWRGRKAAAIRRKAEQEELKMLRKAVVRKNKQQQLKPGPTTVSSNEGYRKPQPTPRASAMGQQSVPTNIYSSFF